MANTLYDYARELFATAALSWTAHDIKLVGIDATDYVVNAATDQFLDDIPAIGRVCTSGNLGGKTATLGVLDATDGSIAAVPVGDAMDAWVIYRDTGNAATSPLIAYLDSSPELPITPNGGDINYTFDNGANKILRL